MAVTTFPGSPQRVLVVDDDVDMCWVLRVALTGLGCAVLTVATGGDAISAVVEKSFSLAFVDARLPDMDGLQLVGRLRSQQPRIRIVMISGYYLADDPRIVDAIRRSQIDQFVAKPFQIAAIAAAMKIVEWGIRPAVKGIRAPNSA
jgi:CheY-like chemotaxis protein